MSNATPACMRETADAAACGAGVAWARGILVLLKSLCLQMLYTNWQSTGNSFEGAFGGYDDVSVNGFSLSLSFCSLALSLAP